MQELHVDAVVEGHVILDAVAEGARLVCWRARSPEGREVTVHELVGASQRERQLYSAAMGRVLSATRDRPAGLAQVVRTLKGRGMCITGVTPSGTLADVPLLDWDTFQKLDAVRDLGAGLRDMHALKLIHGCARPSHVLLDEEMRPLWADIGALDLATLFAAGAPEAVEYQPYAAPEVRAGQPAGALSDIYGFGRLCEHLFTGADPAEPDDDVPRLDALARSGAPAGLVRIVRRCCSRDPKRRYRSAAELLGDLQRYDQADAVGVTHPEGLEGVEDADAGEAERERMRQLARQKRRSEPPPAKAGPVIVISSSKEGDRRDPLEGTPSRVLGALGVVALLAGLALAYFVAEASAATGALIAVGAAGASMFAPLTRLRDRLVLALAAGTLLLVLDPSAPLARIGARARFAAGAPTARAATVVTARGQGRMDFNGLDLSGADFTGQDLRGTNFSGTNLSAAIFRRALMAGVVLADARVEGADFSGAKLRYMIPQVAKGWPEARCDEATEMPAGWQCKEGKPVAEAGPAGKDEGSAK